MKKGKTRHIFFLLFIFMALFALIGCKSEFSPSDNTPTAVVTPAPTKIVTIPDDSGNASSNATQLVSMQYYIIDTSDNELSTAVALVPADEEISPETVMDFFIDSLADESVELKLDSIEQESDLVIISFDESMLDIAAKNADLEAAILDAAAQGILDNVKSCKRICYRILGKEYVTANKNFSADYIYMGD